MSVEPNQIKPDLQKILFKTFLSLISETNGISIIDTLDLALNSGLKQKSPEAHDLIFEFLTLIRQFIIHKTSITTLLQHPVSGILFEFFKNFPLKYNDEHIHLTGSMTAEFIYPRLKVLLDGPQKHIYEEKIRAVYGDKSIPIQSVRDVDQLIRLKDKEGFSDYLRILYLPKLILSSKKAHSEAAYHLAEELYTKFNVGSLRLKFSLSRSTENPSEQIPGIDDVTTEDVVLGLYEGFKTFQKKFPDFNFILSPSFRKESNHFDSDKYESRKEHFLAQIDELISMIDKYPFLQDHFTDVDTVGDERELYRKEHFSEMKTGLRKIQFRGINIRSHHGETWHTLKKGIQAVDNAMNIWHIDTLEHGISLGINPNYYFQKIYQECLRVNQNGLPISSNHPYYKELIEFDWTFSKEILNKLINGEVLNEEEKILFVKSKFHTAREVEHYQHDVLNRLIQKGVTLVALPSSNNKLTGQFESYKDHPFSWWEKKNVQLQVGTDNYITLNTNFIQEMLILLYSDPENLKITKLLMVTTGENRRPYLSHLLWKMRKHLTKIK